MRTSSHRARAIVATLAASLALVTVIGPVAAAEPTQGVTIVSPMTSLATQRALHSQREPADLRVRDVVHTRLVVLRGSFETDFVLTVNNTFTCDDGSGKFSARLLVRISGGVETFTWVILGGTGRYHGPFGLGSGSTEPCGGGATNTDTGYLFR